MTIIDKEKIRAELDEWGAKLEKLKLQGALLKMEARDRKDEVVRRLDSAYQRAREKFHDVAGSTEKEVDRANTAFRAAWDAFKSSWRDVTNDE